MSRQFQINRVSGTIIAIILAVTVWLFFAIFYRQHLHYHEQMQLFLFTGSYFTDSLMRPGGLAVYLNEFCVQFFFDSFLGGFIIALLLVALQLLVAKVSGNFTNKPAYKLLTTIPSIYFGLLLLDENTLLTGLIAAILSLLAVILYHKLNKRIPRICFLLFATPILYWLAGWGTIVFPALCLLFEWFRKRNIKEWLLTLIGVALITATVLTITYYSLTNYPLGRILLAGDYYRYVYNYTYVYSFIIFIALIVLIPLVIHWLPRIQNKKAFLSVQIVQLILLVLFINAGVARMADWKKEEVMAYDYFARTGKWYNILRMADKKAPDGPLTVSILNLALAKTGKLPENMFNYIQNGPQGLIPPFAKEYIASVMVGEIYYHLGLVNASRHFAFEAMEAIPDYRKSIRCIQRLAETNLINGDYTVAARYLKILQKTFTCREWATETLAVLGNEAYIDAHEEWGSRRRFRPQNDFLFSEQEKDMMLGLLFEHNNANFMACEYLLAYTLLNKDLKRFAQYYQLAESRVKYETIPRFYQEALAYIWSLSNFNPAFRPVGLDAEVVSNLKKYLDIKKSRPDSAPMLRNMYGNTYWYYLEYK